VAKFESVHRLVFYHGRQFGGKLGTYIGINMTKALLYMMSNYINNYFNGFSGMVFFDNFYFSLFNILNTTVACSFMLIADQDLPLTK